MIRLSKSRFNSAIEGTPASRTDLRPTPSSPIKHNRGSLTLAIALAIAIGLGAGWLGGRALNDRMRDATTTAPASDVPAGGNLTPASTDAQASSKRRSAAAPSLPPAVGDEQPVAASESRATPPDPNPTPPKTPKVDKDDEPETQNAFEDPSKEIGRKAFKKMLKDVKRMRRGIANKSDDEDR